MNLPDGITVNHLVTLLCCGFEGGVNYWCRIVDYIRPERVEPVCSRVSGFDDLPIFRHIDYPLSGGAVICEDLEHPERDYLVLDAAAIERGVRLMIECSPQHWGDFLRSWGDADTGDIFIQYALLGEHIYG
jgi:hypothetical protein